MIRKGQIILPLNIKILFYSLLILVLFTSCKESVISSSAGNISPGTFNYLKFVFYNDQNDLNKVVAIIKNEYAKGALADKLNVQEDKSYKRFNFMGRRNRANLGGVALLKKQFGKDINKNNTYLKYNIDINERDVAEKIYNSINRNKKILQVSNPDLIIGTWNKGSIKLSDFKDLLFKEEWEQLLSLSIEPLTKAIEGYSRLWLYSQLNEILIDQFGADRSELERVDHNYVSNLFLLAKYTLAGDGIYPVGSIKIKFMHKELFEHFQRVKNKLLNVTSTKAQFTVVKDMATANDFMRELKSGKVFKKLAASYAISPIYIKSATPVIYHGYKMKIALKKRVNRSLIDKLILDIAQRGFYNPDPYPLKDGVVIVKILDIQREKRKIEYKNYISMVEIDLNNTLLKRQYPIDLKDMNEELNFKIRLKLLDKKK